MAYREGEWKLIHHAATLEDAKEELFNIAIDPREEQNLIADQPEIYRLLWEKFKEQVEMED